ncbi:F-box protein CPR30-like [Chenopodium quinoa]|uniref:F-box protein CPR30-like n=1 Tax=Chenopodium quinoa TaxID=63459 RepID=UPI000B78DD56|nr:F-box protein CPR30-like [Chenopodium quinoa]
MSSPPQSPPHKKLKSSTEDAGEETLMHIISSETQNSETQNNETQNSETQNSATQNSETQNREIQNRETQKREIPKHMILKFLSETQNREIPDHVILTEILPRLPVDSLLRFKQVCKEWELLISSPDFINDHAFRQNPLSSRSVLSIANDSSLTAIDYEDLDFTPLGQYSSVNPIFLIGSSHGLVLLISSDATKGQLRFPSLLLYFEFDFRTFNPVFGGLGNTIYPPPKFLQSTDFAAKDYSFGFGYSSTHDEFYIVAINFLVSSNHPVVVVFLYNCSTQKWIEKHKVITAPSYEEQRMAIILEDVWYKHSGTLVNEALHWGAIIVLEDLWCNHQCIVGFDLGSQKLGFMSLPSANFGESAIFIRSAFSLCCLNDFLCAWAYFKGGRRVEMWMMKEYGVRKSWTKLFCADMNSTYWYFFGKPRQIMIFNFDGLRYVDFSCITPRWSKVDFQDQVKAVNYVQSLLSPDAIIKYPTSGEENE